MSFLNKLESEKVAVKMGQEEEQQASSSIEAQVDVAQEATSLPPYSPKAEILSSAEEMFTNIEDYLSSEINGSLSLFSQK